MNVTESRVVPVGSPNQNALNHPSFLAMQSQMATQLEDRRKEWEQEVEKMQEDFFQTKLNDQNNRNKSVNRNVDIQLPAHALRSTGFNSKLTEIGNAKTVFGERVDGTKLIKFQLDMSEFDPRGISVKAQGGKLLVTAKMEQEDEYGNKRSRQLTRQIDIPTNVNADDFVSKMSADGTLSIEAPYEEDDTFAPAIAPPAYHGLENDDDIYFVTRSEPSEYTNRRIHHTTTPTEYSSREMHVSSPFATDRYNLHTNIEVSAPPRSTTERYYTTNTYRKPDVNIKRYYSDYKDPGPLDPLSRGEQLRKSCPKGYMNHMQASKAVTPTYSPSIRSTTTHLDNSYTTPSYQSISSTTNYNDNTRLAKPKPKVTIIREYENDESTTLMSPPVRTSVFREYDSSTSSDSPAPLSRERHSSTSSGDKIIYPTKYKKQMMSMSQSSDSETSSFSTSPPIRDVTPKQLFSSTPKSTKVITLENMLGAPISPSPRSPTSLTNGFPTSAPRSPIMDTVSNMNGAGFPSPLGLCGTSHPNVITTEEGQRLKMHIDIGSTYAAEEITVQLKYKKVTIRAVHEDIIGGRTSRSEFSRDFDLPAPLEPTTVRAVLASNGKLFVGGSLMTNLYHHKVLDLVLCDMPTNARACSVKY